ncbi:hypothetical protein BC940DRAFT_299104 [Gongronella butleri]|nr:hypothetical protein BC940DRAFT_299104 [Gongronella butleri]
MTTPVFFLDFNRWGSPNSQPGKNDISSNRCSREWDEKKNENFRLADEPMGHASTTIKAVRRAPSLFLIVTRQTLCWEKKKVESMAIHS